MSWLSYHFTCPCGHTYEDIVQGPEGRPDPCPKCASTKAVRQMSAPMLCKERVPMYPGNKRQTAGYGHQARRPAEKAGRQVAVPRKKTA